MWTESSVRWRKAYDVYVCCSDSDFEYANALVIYLQGQPERLRCFLPLRDMNIGGAIPTELTEGAEKSHCWVMLLTPGFLSEEWCQYQMHQLQTMSPFPNGRLIPVMLGLPFDQYPKQLKLIHAYKAALGDQAVFGDLRTAIVSYLGQLPAVPDEKISSAETSSNHSESGPSSSRMEKSSVTHESTGDLSERGNTRQDSSTDKPGRSSETPMSIGDLPKEVFMSQESAGDKSLRGYITQESQSDTSLRSFITGDHTKDLSGRSSVTQGSTSGSSMRPDMSQDPLSDASLRSLTQGSPGNTSMRKHDDLLEKSPVTYGPQSCLSQESTSDSSMRPDMSQDHLSDASLRSMMTPGSPYNTSRQMHNFLGRSSVTQELQSFNQQGTSSTTQRNSIRQELTGRSSVTQGSTSEISSFRIFPTQESIGDLPQRSSETHGPQSFVTEDGTSDTSQRSSIVQELISRRSVRLGSTDEISFGVFPSQESTSNSLLKSSVTKESPSATPLRSQTSQDSAWNSSVKPEPTNNASPIFMTQSSFRDALLTSSVTDNSTLGSSVMLESTSGESFGSFVTEESKPNTGLSLGICDKKVSSVDAHWKTPTSRASVMSYAEQNPGSACQAATKSCKKTTNLHSCCLCNNIYTSCDGAQNGRETVHTLQSKKHISFGGAQMNIDLHGLCGGVYPSCAGAETEINCRGEGCICFSKSKDEKESPHLQSDLYNSYRAQVENCNMQSLQGDVCNSCVGTKKLITSHHKENYISSRSTAKPKQPWCLQSDLYNSCGGGQMENRNAQSLQNNMYTCREAQAEIGDSLHILDNIYTSLGRPQTELGDSSNIKEKIFGGTQAINEDSQCLQRDIYYNQTENEETLTLHFNTNCDGQAKHKNIQGDLYTSSMMIQDSFSNSLQSNIFGTQNRNSNSKTPQGNIYTGFGRVQGGRSPSNLLNDLHSGSQGGKLVSRSSSNLPSDIYTSSGGIPAERKDSGVLSSDLYMSTDQTTDQNPPAFHGNVSRGCTCLREGNGDSHTSRDIYCSDTSTCGAPVAKSLLHTCGADKPPSEAADKT